MYLTLHDETSLFQNERSHGLGLVAENHPFTCNRLFLMSLNS